MKILQDSGGDRYVALMLLLLGAGKLERETPHCAPRCPSCFILLRYTNEFFFLNCFQFISGLSCWMELKLK